MSLSGDSQVVNYSALFDGDESVSITTDPEATLVADVIPDTVKPLSPAKLSPILSPEKKELPGDHMEEYLALKAEVASLRQQVKAAELQSSNATELKTELYKCRHLVANRLTLLKQFKTTEAYYHAVLRQSLEAITGWHIQYLAPDHPIAQKSASIEGDHSVIRLQTKCPTGKLSLYVLTATRDGSMTLSILGYHIGDNVNDFRNGLEGGAARVMEELGSIPLLLQCLRSGDEVIL
ncbi:Mitotic spindle assembly checkpoint protein MAD1 [Carpediemonas membranifera]|uniref:Mitotic spindle assembly checkpoint protein MAD1 n=1 Tax=Carpediemonas membranifera TaxID=201153 RepID=A0A8J6E7V9_9EUKA|nr:Mitotic spindle assembly checkpoint protein MAD1 [Carpediemonas membranifera]|eukprot:KAG9391135.1 Mitotic spindle assembly checkpoint protein MAD1 [Carpediemonas membranifera]